MTTTPPAAQPCGVCRSTARSVRPYGPGGTWICATCAAAPTMVRIVREQMGLDFARTVARSPSRQVVVTPAYGYVTVEDFMSGAYGKTGALLGGAIRPPICADPYDDAHGAAAQCSRAPDHTGAHGRDELRWFLHHADDDDPQRRAAEDAFLLRVATEERTA